MGHEKFEANITPTSDGFEKFYNSLPDTTRRAISGKLSVGFQLLLEVELFGTKLLGVVDPLKSHMDPTRSHL